jgi:hypothetical protein
MPRRLRRDFLKLAAPRKADRKDDVAGAWAHSMPAGRNADDGKANGIPPNCAKAYHFGTPAVNIFPYFSIH